MQIRPPGSGGPLPPVSNQDQAVKNVAKAVRPEALAGPGKEEAFQSIKAEFHKTDLQDPAKVDQIISRCSGELLQTALERTGGKISPADTANLTEFLQNDPVIRGKLLNYLERVLT
jgi:hypothetical protein